jgi:hypothetical protein
MKIFFGILSSSSSPTDPTNLSLAVTILIYLLHGAESFLRS